jgi:hypothetical protein
MVEGSYVSGLEDEIDYLRGVIRDEKRDHDERMRTLMVEDIEKNGRIDELEEECRELHVRVCELHDLVREMLPPLLEKDCLWCVHHWNNRGDCTDDGKCLLEERAKKLGIEAEPC